MTSGAAPAWKRPSVIPGFGITLGFTLTYLGLIVLIPLGGLVLKSSEVPRATLGSTTKLGWTTWLGERRSHEDAADLVLVHETIAVRARLAAP